MHEGQVAIEVGLVRRLLRDQWPGVAHRSIRPVDSTGTVNALFRIGEDLVARLPLVARWADGIEREWEWLPWFSDRVTTALLPEPVFKGRPTDDYPLPWAVHRWIDGATYDDDVVDDERSAAETVGRFVLELRSLEVPDHAPRGGRRPLRELDAGTREAIRAADGMIDASAAMTVWEEALDTPAWDGAATWIHGDLLRPNLLVRDGRLEAVIDFGGVGIGDPAIDLMPAWSVFGPAGREVFGSMLEVDEATWSRGRGIALHQAAMVIPYYAETNPRFVELSSRAIGQIVDDFSQRR
jgi:aminoglycoside phosphotransferase (APT) family kinase protein